MNKPKVAFICTHNSCRSQIAEALGKHLASDVFESYSAGTELKSHINPDAVRLIKRLYGVDMELTQTPKLISEIPPVDVVITMGCGDACPFYPGKRYEDWTLDDPAGKGVAEVRPVRDEIRARIEELIASLLPQDAPIAPTPS